MAAQNKELIRTSQSWHGEKRPEHLKGKTETTGYLDKNPAGYCHLSQSLFEFAKIAKDNRAF